MKLWCREDDGHLVTVRMQPSPGERYCPDHGCPLVPMPKERKPAGVGRRESSAETRARQAFNRAVCEWPCFFQRHREGHTCAYPLDAHHLVPKQFLRLRLELPEDELLEVLYNPLIGAPLCRSAHNAVEARADFIYRDELSPECLRFVASLPSFVLIRLEEQCPSRKAAA